MASTVVVWIGLESSAAIATSELRNCATAFMKEIMLHMLELPLCMVERKGLALPGRVEVAYIRINNLRIIRSVHHL
jgi:hypothetical protein